MICDIISQYAGVAESADATDSKSVGSDIVRVQVPPPAPKKTAQPQAAVLFSLVPIAKTQNPLLLLATAIICALTPYINF